MNTHTVITTTTMREIPLNKLVPSKDNVRRTQAGLSIDELAASILSHGLIQNLTVRPELNDEGRETGKFEVTAGGRRLAALKVLAAKKQIAKNAPVACSVRENGIAKELSLAENIERVNLHPADQFEAFRDLIGAGLGAEDVAARFGVSVRTVKERLKLGAVSAKLLQLYREGGLSLEQLMAFAVVDDPQRQEEVHAALSFNKSPDAIRRQLLQTHVPGHDKRVQFVGLAAYEAAGGQSLRDLFADDHGGYLADPALLDRLTRAKLEAAAEAIRAEGWKWVEAAPDFNHAHGMQRVYPHDVELSDEEAERLGALDAEIDTLAANLEEAEEPDPEAEARLSALHAEYDALDAKGQAYEPEEVAHAGAFVSIGHEGELEIVRGFVRPEDRPKPAAAETKKEAPTSEVEDGDEAGEREAQLSASLVAELTAHRTMALRDALGANTELAIAALTHAFALQTFFYGSLNSCLKISLRCTPLEHYAPGIGDGVAARHIAERQEAWRSRMPDDGKMLWDFVQALPQDERLSLLAHCAALSVEDAAFRPRTAGTLTPADIVAVQLKLDMRDYWTPTAETYLGRVPKSLITEAVTEALSAQAAEPLAKLKKAEMAHAAEQLLASTRWLPAILRTPLAENGETIHQAAE